MDIFEIAKAYGEVDYDDFNTGVTYLIAEYNCAKRLGLPDHGGIRVADLITGEIIDLVREGEGVEVKTNADQQRIAAICKAANINDISDLSDGYHTFRQLYFQRMMLFAALVKQNHDKAWKSLCHENGELCFGGGWFIVGIDTPKGSYTYHYEDKYFNLFNCEELERGKPWDGHTEKDVTRLLSLESQELCEDVISRQAAIDVVRKWFDKIQLNGDICLDGIISLPPVAPQQKIGHWIRVDKDKLRCSRCEVIHLIAQYPNGKIGWCPNCGAKMIEPQESKEEKSCNNCKWNNSKQCRPATCTMIGLDGHGLWEKAESEE